VTTDYDPYRFNNERSVATFGVELHDVEIVPWAIYVYMERNHGLASKWLNACCTTLELPRYGSTVDPFSGGGELYSERFWMLVAERCIWIIDHLHGKWWIDVVSPKTINGLFRFQHREDEVPFRLAFAGDKSRLDR